MAYIRKGLHLIYPLDFKILGDVFIDKTNLFIKTTKNKNYSRGKTIGYDRLLSICKFTGTVYLESYQSYWLRARQKNKKPIKENNTKLTFIKGRLIKKETVSYTRSYHAMVDRNEINISSDI